MTDGLQRCSSLNELYDQAAWAQNFLGQKVAALAGGHGAELVDPGLKSRASAERKLNDKYLGDVRRMTDVARCSIVCDSLEQVRDVLDGLQREFGVEDLEDRFAKPKDSGYRDAAMKLRCPNGHVAEVQVHLRPLIQAKKAEIYYFESRQLTAIRDRDLTDAEAETLHGLNANARALYEGAVKRDPTDTVGTGSPATAMMDASRAGDRARAALTAWRNAPEVRALTRDIARTARERGVTSEEVMKGVQPDGPDAGLFKGLTQALRNPATGRAYAEMHNALEDCAFAWGRAISVTGLQGGKAQDLQAIAERLEEVSTELGEMGAGVPAQPGYTAMRQSLALPRQARDHAERIAQATLARDAIVIEHTERPAVAAKAQVYQLPRRGTR